MYKSIHASICGTSIVVHEEAAKVVCKSRGYRYGKRVLVAAAKNGAHISGWQSQQCGGD